MLINFNSDKTINWFNTNIDKVESEKYLSENTIWIDNIAVPEIKDNDCDYILKFNEDNSVIIVEYIDPEEPQATNNEIVENQYSIMMAITDLYEMNMPTE